MRLCMTHVTVAVFPERDPCAATWWETPHCNIPENVAAKEVSCQHSAVYSYFAKVQPVRSPPGTRNFLKEFHEHANICHDKYLHSRGVPGESFVFQEGGLTS